MAVDCVEIHLNRMFHLSSHDNFNVSSNYEKAVKRTGHARFRRGPSSSPAPAPDSHGPSTSSQSEDNKQLHAPSDVRNDCFSNKSVTETTSSTSSGADGSVSNGKQFSSLGIIAPAPTFSSRKPPLPSTHRKRCSADRPVASVHGSEKQSHNYSVSRRKIGSVTPSDNCSVSRSGCHCCKRRKTGSIIRRVPIIGSNVTSIPADDYSWKKYGEKKIDGSLYPRVYYKCNTGKGCPARKRVELSKDDSKMLLVSYDGEHRHRVALTPVPLSLTGVVV